MNTRVAGLGVALSSLVSIAGLLGCRSDRSAHADSAPAAAVEAPRMTDDKPRDYAGLHNVVAYHDGFYSGSVPEGEAGFRALKALGIRTIISVDGAEPEVDRARAAGMRYIHLPIGYNGFDESRKHQLVRATRDAMKEGPVYIHCHHGKHRSAGAAGTIAASLGWASPEAMVGRMKVSGTAPGYKGLYACTASAGVLDDGVIGAVDADFPEVSHPVGFVKGMVEIDEVFDHLRSIEKAGWKTPHDHPDLVPVAEAGRLADLFRLLAVDARSKAEPADFGEQLTTDGRNAQAVEDMLAAGEKDLQKISASFALVAASCKDCHVKHRD